jgi:hypothetical protein
MTLIFDLPQTELVRKVAREQRIGHMTVNPMAPIRIKDIDQQIKVFRMVFAYHDDPKYMLERIQELEEFRKLLKDASGNIMKYLSCFKYSNYIG